MATECGLKAALAIPILAKADVIAVIEFFLREPRPEDQRLVKVITAIATQLGMAFERKRAEEELRQYREHLEELVGIAQWPAFVEKGKPFNPDASARKILDDAAKEARAWLEARYEALLGFLTS